MQDLIPQASGQQFLFSNRWAIEEAQCTVYCLGEMFSATTTNLYAGHTSYFLYKWIVDLCPQQKQWCCKFSWVPIPPPPPLPLPPSKTKKNKDVSVINRQARGGNTGSNYMGTAQLGLATVDSLGMTKNVSQNSLTYVGEFFSELSAVYIPHRF